MPLKPNEPKEWEMDIPTSEGPVKCRVRQIESSNIEWIAWPANGDPLLIVQFEGASRYGYIGVSRQRAVACAYAKSTGEYLNRIIKPNYEVVRLR